MTTIEHEPDCGGEWNRIVGRREPCVDWCYGCERCEPLRPGDYRICGECFHVFRTAVELTQMVKEQTALDGLDLVAVLNADEIAVCPVCAHDF